MTEHWSPPPFGPMSTRQALSICWQVVEKLSSAGWTPKDISDVRWSYRIRGWDDAGTYHFDLAISKSATEDTEGWLEYALPLGDTARPVLLWRISEVDANTLQTGTKSGQLERTVIQWKQAIEETPTP